MRQIKVCYCIDIFMQQVCFEQFMYQNWYVICCLEVVNIGWIVWVEMCYQWYNIRKVREVILVNLNIGCVCYCYQVYGVVSGIIGCQQCNDIVYYYFFIDYFIDWYLFIIIIGYVCNLMRSGSG